MHSPKPIIWSIGGSDCSGGAGIQADLHTVQALGGNGCSIVTMITAQNSHAVAAVHPVAPELIHQQIEVLRDNLIPMAVKLGALGNKATIAAIVPWLSQYKGWKVCDPVLKSSSGTALLDPEAIQLLLTKVLPFIDLLTPNIPEASRLTGLTITSYADLVTAAQRLLELGCKSVLLKGGHLDSQYAADYWTNGSEETWLISPRYDTPYNHGSGCTLSTAIATALALGYGMKDALVIAKMYLNQGHALLNQHQPFGAILHSGWPSLSQYLPRCCEDYTEITQHYDIPRLQYPHIGLYPIVDSVSWLDRLANSGATTFQLRIKDQDKTGTALEEEIAAGIKLAKALQLKLYINDYWELAIKHGAFGVHLGQSDLSPRAVRALASHGIHLGISTHSYWEVARAHHFNPSYMASGPIFATTSKIMDFAPQTIEGLCEWRKVIAYPLVAIGGINLANIGSVASCGVDGIAMIAAITQAADPCDAAKQLRQRMYTS